MSLTEAQEEAGDHQKPSLGQRLRTAEATVAALREELQDWRELVEAVCELPLPPEQRKKKLWPNKWHQDCAMVAFALHGSEETAAELVLAIGALDDIATLAHCIAKAGPANTPTLDDAWSKFNLISVKATTALAPGRKP